MIIDLLRHGEVEGKACFRGHTDEPLSATGWQQMDAALNNYSSDIVITSPLKRCSQFTETWSSSKDKAFIENDSFMEIDFGDWDGLTADEIKINHENELLSYWQNPLKNTPPNGEALVNFKQRIITALEALIYEHKDQNILLITHGGVIRMIIAYVLSIPMDKLLSIECELASLSRIRISFDDENYYASLVFHGVDAKGFEK